MTKEACEEFMFGENGIMQLVANEEYAPALEAIIRQGYLYPEISKILLGLQISLATNVNDVPQALQVMEEALSAGIYLPAAVFSVDADPPGYAVLFGNPIFERLKKLHQEGYRDAIDRVAPVLNRVLPVTETAKPPLLIAFHGNTSSNALEADQYRHVSRLGWLLVQPQSAQSWTAWGYVWGDKDVTERQVRSYWEMIQDQDSFDLARIVTAGISKGGEVAIWSVMTGTIPACGFITIAPGGPLINDPDRLRSLIRARQDSNLRGYLIVGDEDRRAYEPARQLASVLNAEGFACELEICHGMGHEFPEDFEERLGRALEFVTNHKR